MTPPPTITAWAIKAPVVILVLCILFSGCTVRDGALVDCSSGHLVTDFYATPSGKWVEVDGERHSLKAGTLIVQPIHKGDYLIRDGSGLWVSVNLTKENESETGLRDACRVQITEVQE